MTEYERLTLGLQTAAVRLLAELGDQLGRLAHAEDPAGPRRPLAEAVSLARAAVADADQSFDLLAHYLAAPG
ncbi:MAG: hypothetical protein K2X82_06080 [Gemmataceae bacterium]|nr:hypothetical protein [Gemmataceae bacterium]